MKKFFFFLFFSVIVVTSSYGQKVPGGGTIENIDKSAKAFLKHIEQFK